MYGAVSSCIHLPSTMNLYWWYLQGTQRAREQQCHAQRTNRTHHVCAGDELRELRQLQAPAAQPVVVAHAMPHASHSTKLPPHMCGVFCTPSLRPLLCTCWTPTAGTCWLL
jgi:hypothetical protein